MRIEYDDEDKDEDFQEKWEEYESQ